jgi:anti-sigma factor RsiW
MNCADYNESLSGLLDGELPAAQAAALAAHLAGCPACAQTLAELAALRADLAQMLPAGQAPADLQARIEALLGPEAAAETKIVPLRQPRRLPRASRALWLAMPALAAALIVALLPRHDPTKDLLSVHDAVLRSASLTSGPMAAAPVAAPPSVPGFQLTANRTDIVAGHAAQVASYVRDGHSITLCIWPANGEPAHGVRQAVFQGMTIKYWNDGDHEYWAASAGPADNLAAFVRALAMSS